MSEIDWKMDKESILQELCLNFSKELEGTCFTIMRNSTKGEKNLDLFQEGKKLRAGQIWPKKNDCSMDLVLDRDIIDTIKHEVEFLTDYNVVKNRNLVRGYYKKLEYEKVMEIIKAMRRHYGK